MMQSRTLRWLLVGASLALFAVVLVRTAWIGDDAYITLRTVDNFVNGHGLRWNVAERVQTYTHPLWMFLLTGVYSVVRDPLWTVFPLSMLCSIAAVAMLLLQAPTRLTCAVAVVWLVGSRAFMDFSTSGLENPLSHLLLGVIAWLSFRFQDKGEARDARWLLLGCGLLLTNRLDLGAIVLPLVLWVWVRRTRAVGFARSTGEQFLGFAPLILWLLFSTIYYGTPLPNTAYAKASTGIPQSALIGQGLNYFAWLFRSDPVTGVGIVLALVFGWRRGAAAAWLTGAILYLLYVLKIGGDFMGSRMFAAPFWVGVWVLCRSGFRAPATWYRDRHMLLPAGLALALLAPVAPWLTGGDFGSDGGRGVPWRWIQDERRNYYPAGGLISEGLQRPVAGDLGRQMLSAPVFETRPAVLVMNWVGATGFLAGPKAHIIDDWLCDPVLVRLPAWTPLGRFRIGHFDRRVPIGYLETVRDGFTAPNGTWRGPIRVEPESIRGWVGDVRTMVSAPIFSGERWAAIGRLWGGAHDAAVAEFGARFSVWQYPSALLDQPREHDVADVTLSAPPGGGPLPEGPFGPPWFLTDDAMMPPGGDLVRFGKVIRDRTFQLALGTGVGSTYSLHGDALLRGGAYSVQFFLGDEKVGSAYAGATAYSGEGDLHVFTVEPSHFAQKAQQDGYDAILITPMEPRRNARFGGIHRPDPR